MVKNRSCFGNRWGVTMSYGFSATTKAFYVYEDKESYEANGNWPEDVKPVSDQVWEKYCMQGPEGKERGANKRGLPCWVDIPAPAKETQTAAAIWKKGCYWKRQARRSPLTGCG
ncbi:tail fiber assembly protein [Serratia ureilytica]